MDHLRHPLPDASDCGATLSATQGDTLSQRNKVCLGRHTWGAIPFLGFGESLPLSSSAVSIPRSQAASAVSRPQVLDTTAAGWHSGIVLLLIA